MSAAPVLVLSRTEVIDLMTPAGYLDAVEAGFQALRAGQADIPPPWHIAGDGGGFHGKGASIRLDRLYVALKLNGNFPDNPALRGLPTIQGAILLCDGETGSLLAIIDSIEVTLRRTAAATALAARHLARPDSATLLICGCGAQAPAQLEALAAILPIDRILAWDRDPTRLLAGADRVGDLRDAAHQADIIVTCTSATEPFLARDMIRPGTFIAAVGADAPHKSEIEPALMAAALVVVDSLDQCLAMGDLRHAVAAGAVQPADVAASLADLAADAHPGRTDPDQVTLFDSTGTAIQDVVSAVRIYQCALAAGVGTPVQLAA